MGKIKGNKYEQKNEAVKVFTDREDPQEAFERKFEALYEDWRHDYFVLCYYGIGGVGKTSFINKLCRVIRGVEGNELRYLDKIDCDYIKYDFNAKNSGVDKETILYHFRNQLLEINNKFRFFHFDYAMYAYAKKTGETRENDKEAETLLEKMPWLDSLVNAVGLIPGVNFAASAIQAFDKLSSVVIGAIGKHIDKTKFQKHLREVEGLESSEILDKLHEYFCEDMFYNMQNISERPIVVFMDTYEKYIDTLNREFAMITEDHWLRKGENSVIRSIPGILWVITGREKLCWEDWEELKVESPLSKMTEEEKKQLARTELEQHLLGDLSDKDAKSFLINAGITDTTLCDQIYKLTNGTPLYLDICVDTYNTLIGKNIEPNIKLFGEDVTQLISRYLNNMSEENREMTYFLATLGVWDDESVKEVASKATTLHYYRFAKYTEFMSNSFIIKNDNGTYNMHDTVRFAAMKNADKEIVDEVSRINLPMLKEKLDKSSGVDTNIVISEYIRVMFEYELTYEEVYENIKGLKDYFSVFVDNGQYDILYFMTKKVFENVAIKYPNTLVSYISENYYGRALVLKGFVKEALDVVSDIPFDNIDEDEIRLDIMSGYALILNANGLYSQSLEIQIAIYEKELEILGENHLGTIASMNNLAFIYRELGEYQKALEINETGYEKIKEMQGENHPNTITSMNNLALCYGNLGEYQKALEIHKEVYEKRCEILGEDHPDTIMSINNLAVLYSNLGEYQKALEIHKEVYEKRREILGENHPDTIMSINNLSTVYSSLGEYQKALEMDKEVYEKRREILGEDHPDTIMSINNLAVSYSNLGEYQKALEMSKAAYEKNCKILGEDHPDTLLSMNNLSGSYKDLGEYQKALEMDKAVYEKRREILGEDHPDTLTSMNNLASSYFYLEEYQKALELFKTVYEKECEIQGEHPKIIKKMYNISTVYEKLGECQKAFEMEKLAYEKRLKILGENHPDTLESMHTLAYRYLKMDEKQIALEMYKTIYEKSCKILGENHPNTQSTKNIMDILMNP